MRDESVALSPNPQNQEGGQTQRGGKGDPDEEITSHRIEGPPCKGWTQNRTDGTGSHDHSDHFSKGFPAKVVSHDRAPQNNHAPIAGWEKEKERHKHPGPVHPAEGQQPYPHDDKATSHDLSFFEEIGGPTEADSPDDAA